MANNHLNKAKKVKDDEFYTLREDVECIVEFLKNELKGQIVFCPFDSAESEFVKVLSDRKDELGLKDLWFSDSDFFGKESQRKLAECDVVISNPPFSICRDIVNRLVKSGKKWCLLSPTLAFSYVDIVRLFGMGAIRSIGPDVRKFKRPDCGLDSVSCNWIANMRVDEIKDNYSFNNYIDYEEGAYPLCDSYYNPDYDEVFDDVIYVDKVANIPMGYKGRMAVPVTFLKYFSPAQYLIWGVARPKVNGVRKFVRIIISERGF